MILTEKGEIINQLNKNLEDAQKHVQELMARPNYQNEIARLKDTNHTLELQNEEMIRTINNLNQK